MICRLRARVSTAFFLSFPDKMGLLLTGLSSQGFILSSALLVSYLCISKCSLGLAVSNGYSPL